MGRRWYLGLSLACALALPSASCRKAPSEPLDEHVHITPPGEGAWHSDLRLNAEAADVFGSAVVEATGVAEASMAIVGPAGSTVVIAGQSTTLAGGQGSLKVPLLPHIASAPAMFINVSGGGAGAANRDEESIDLGSWPVTVTRPGRPPVSDELSVRVSPNGVDKAGKLALFSVKSGHALPRGRHRSSALLWFDAESPSPAPWLIGSLGEAETIADIERVAFTTHLPPRPIGVCNFSGVGTGASINFSVFDTRLSIYDTHTAKVVKETVLRVDDSCPKTWAAERGETTAAAGRSFSDRKEWLEKAAHAK